MKRVLKLMLVVAALVALVVLAGCSGSGGGSSSAPSSSGGASSGGSSSSGGAASGGTAVSIANFAFDPASLTVKVGDTVTWTNKDSVAHTVTADDGSFKSEQIQPGAAYKFTFAKAGTFSYHCSIHPNMTGSITVQ